MILLIDNYDSFSYNLYQLVGSLSPDIQVVRNDQVTCGGHPPDEPQPPDSLPRPRPPGGRRGV